MTRQTPLSTDKGYGWVVAVAATVVVFFQLGMVNVFAVFVPELEEQLVINPAIVGLCISVGIGLRGILGPVWAALAKTISCRKLVMTGGLISFLGMLAVSLSQSALHLSLSMALLSIGSGIPSVTKIVILKRYVVKKFNLAVSLVFTGGTIGMLVLPPLVEYFVIYYGWRGAAILYGALNLHLCLAGALMSEPRYSVRPITGQVLSNSSKENLLADEGAINIMSKTLSVQNMKRVCSEFSTNLVDSLGFSLLTKSRLLVIYLLAMTLHELVLSGWALFLVSYTLEHGYSADVAAFLAAVGGGGALAGRMITGPLTDSGRVSGLKMFFILALGGALSVGCYPFSKSYLALSGVSFVTGLCLGSTTPIYVVILKGLFPENTKDFTAAIGLQYMFTGVGMLMGGPITGWFHDVTQSSEFSFSKLALIEGVAAVLTLAKLPLSYFEKRLIKNEKNYPSKAKGRSGRVCPHVNTTDCICSFTLDFTMKRTKMELTNVVNIDEKVSRPQMIDFCCSSVSGKESDCSESVFESISRNQSEIN